MRQNEWRIEHACPQCGAPADFGEMDALFACGFCRTRFFLGRGRIPRYYIPARITSSKKLFYAPYWRLKGEFFKCPPYRISSSRLDASILAGGPDILPNSLGVKPLAMKLKMLAPDAKGRFIKPELDRARALKKIHSRLKSLGVWAENEKVFLNQYLGQTNALIYAPFFPDRGRILDAITGKPAAVLEKENKFEVRFLKTPGYKVDFLPAICPNCGWDLEGGEKSLAIYCRHCRSGWEPRPGRLIRREFLYLEDSGPQDAHLPFWRIKAKVTGLKLDSFADLIKATNLPKAIQPEMNDWGWFFYTPAFDLPGAVLLRLTRNATISQPHELTAGPAPERAVDASLSPQEAAASLKVALANMVVAKRSVFPLLPELEIKALETILVYIPFESVGRELVNQRLRLSVGMDLMGDFEPE